MKTNKISTLVLLITAAIVVAVYGCKKNDAGTVTSTTYMYAVNIATDAAHGKYLVDKQGRTLYFFSNDAKGSNTCTDGCTAFWPSFYAGTITIINYDPGLNASDFDTIVVNGINQTRYKGWPLYYYAPDGKNMEAAGQIKGESVANWFIAKPDYTIMLANAQVVGNDGKNYIGTTVGVGNTVYFTDANGLTLYTYAPDSFNINKFTKADFSNNKFWPIFDTTSIVVPSALDQTLFTIITVLGKKQMTYKGWPLYYFGSDNKIRGNTKGVSFPSPGVWPIATKDLASAPKK